MQSLERACRPYERAPAQRWPTSPEPRSPATFARCLLSAAARFDAAARELRRALREARDAEQHEHRHELLEDLVAARQASAEARAWAREILAGTSATALQGAAARA